MSNLHYHGFWRMDWGLGNPNKTAALIAILMVAVWILAYVWRRGFWPALILFTGLGICLVHTYSRGGLVAAVAGLAVLAVCAPLRWPTAGLIGLACSLCIIGGVLVHLGAQQRYVQELVREDDSIAHRIEIWKSAPAMMAAASNGWGIGNAGHAYMQWFQPVGQGEKYRTLVNSHLTWLVELGWPLRYLYLLAWAAVLLLCWPVRLHPGMSVAFGVWIALAVAATFSSVAECPWVWIIPAFSLLGALWYRFNCRVWVSGRPWGIAAAACALMLLAITVAGALENRDPCVRYDGHVVIVGSGTPSVWYYAPDEAVAGSYGKSLRLQSPAGVALDFNALQQENPREVIFTGKVVLPDNARLRSSYNILWINPPAKLPDAPKRFILDADNKTIAWGTMRRDANSSDLESWAGTVPNAHWRWLPGAGLFVPDLARASVF